MDFIQFHDSNIQLIKAIKEAIEVCNKIRESRKKRELLMNLKYTTVLMPPKQNTTK